MSRRLRAAVDGLKRARLAADRRTLDGAADFR